MTREKILERKKLLEEALGKLNEKANELLRQRKALDDNIQALVLQANANTTAIKECDFWLEEKPGKEVIDTSRIKPLNNESKKNKRK